MIMLATTTAATDDAAWDTGLDDTPLPAAVVQAVEEAKIGGAVHMEMFAHEDQLEALIDDDKEAKAGRIEATDTTFWFGFKDDVVIRVAPAGEGRGAYVHRSASCVDAALARGTLARALHAGVGSEEVARLGNSIRSLLEAR